MEFLDPGSRGQDIFWDFPILLDLSHDSWENEVLFVKIGVRVLDLGSIAKKLSSRLANFGR